MGETGGVNVIFFDMETTGFENPIRPIQIGAIGNTSSVLTLRHLNNFGAPLKCQEGTKPSSLFLELSFLFALSLQGSLTLAVWSIFAVPPFTKYSLT